MQTLDKAIASADVDEDQLNLLLLVAKLVMSRDIGMPASIEVARRLGFYQPPKRGWWARKFPMFFRFDDSEFVAWRKLIAFEISLMNDPTPSDVQRYARALGKRVEFVLEKPPVRRYHCRPPSLATHMRHRRHELAARQPVRKRHLVL